MSIKIITAIVGLLLAGSLAMFFVPGCTAADLAQIRQQIGLAEAELSKADAAIAALKADKVKIEAQAADLPAGKKKTELLELAAEYQIWIEQSSKWRTQLGTHLRSLHTALDSAEDEIDLIEAVGKEVGSVVPAPIGVFITMGTLLVAAVWRAVRNGRKAAAGTAVVKAVEAARIAGDGTVNFDTPKTAKLLSETMGKTGKAFVDDATGKR